MKLMCNVEVFNRLTEGNGRRKHKKSCLSIGKITRDAKELYIILQTLQNTQGTKYKVKDNIEVVFTKFIKEGKMTIRFKEPPHDLFVQSDPIQLKGFAHIMKFGFTEKLKPSILSLTDVNAKNIVKALKTKIIVKSAEQYPILEGFPRITTELHLAGLGRRSLDRNILKLQQLRILNLSENQIVSLPKDLGSLPNLQELYLAKNLLFKSPKSKWAWMEEVQISRNLKLLDLSFNELTELPEVIGKLGALVTLNVNTNSLKFLPQSLGCLESLKFLDISKNELIVLPGSIRKLRLTNLNVANNSFISSDKSIQINLRLCSLLECSARVVLKSRKHYDASCIPFTLVTYLRKAQYCVCGNPCFDNYIRKPMLIDLSRIADSVVSTDNLTVPFDCIFCSSQCYRRYSG